MVKIEEVKRGFPDPEQAAEDLADEELGSLAGRGTRTRGAPSTRGV